MFYFYTIIIPILIIVVSFYLEDKPSRKQDVINFLFNLVKTFFTYTLLLYYLESELIINVGWTFFAMLFFLIPFSILVIPFKLYYFFKNRSKKFVK